MRQPCMDSCFELVGSRLLQILCILAAFSLCGFLLIVCFYFEHEPIITLQTQFSLKTCNILIDLTFVRIIPESRHDPTDEEQFSDTEIIGMATRAARFSPRFQDFYLYCFLGYCSWIKKKKGLLV